MPANMYRRQMRAGQIGFQGFSKLPTEW